jgi:hypothetical protein
MDVCFELQSSLHNKETRKKRPGRAAREAGPPRLRTAAEWLAYFRANLARPRAIPWEQGAEVSPAQLSAIGRSLQAWQLGETSDGRHLRAAAARYAERVGDPDYPPAVDLFIREEQRHGELLGLFLDLAGVGRVTADWGDRLFRAARYCVTDMEVWTTPVVMVETLALVYYNAVRRATASQVLRAVCAQILADEVPHLRFQCERLAILLCRRSRFGFRLTLLGQRLLFLAVVVLVWAGHRRALRAGGYGWRRYWRAAWAKMNASWRLMDPRRYAGTQGEGKEVGSHPGATPDPLSAPGC